MFKNIVVLVVAVGVLGCSDAPTEVGGPPQERVPYFPPTFAATAGGQALQVAIPNTSAALEPDELLVATGRTGPLDIAECDGVPVTVARYAALITGRANVPGPGRTEVHNKIHFSIDVEPGTRMSGFAHRVTCTIGGIQYQVYDVETQGPAFEPAPAGQVLYVVIPDVGVSLSSEELLVTTARTGPVDIDECDGHPVTAARYAALTGVGGDGRYTKMHFVSDLGAGVRMSKFEHRTTCIHAGVQYQVYFVETQ